jgi:hypothetical protein
LKPRLVKRSLPPQTNRSTCYQAGPGNADPEALPSNGFNSAIEAQPLDIGSQAEPGNQGFPKNVERARMPVPKLQLKSPTT